MMYEDEPISSDEEDDVTVEIDDFRITEEDLLNI